MQTNAGTGMVNIGASSWLHRSTGQLGVRKDRALMTFEFEKLKRQVDRERKTKNTHRKIHLYIIVSHVLSVCMMVEREEETVEPDRRNMYTGERETPHEINRGLFDFAFVDLCVCEKL